MMGFAEFTETFFIGVSLSMDALAVSIALGAAERGAFSWKKMFLTALSFGLFQAFMPLAGWFGGTLLGGMVHTYGRFIASVLLFAVGGKMALDGIREKLSERKNKQASDGENKTPEKFSFARLMVLSFATSIDAFLVGVSFACLGRTDIVSEVSLIGSVTFAISLAGCIAGRIAGSIFGSTCTIAGGIVLVAIGVKALFPC